jgi:hypothetical protein
MTREAGGGIRLRVKGYRMLHGESPTDKEDYNDNPA